MIHSKVFWYQFRYVGKPLVYFLEGTVFYVWDHPFSTYTKFSKKLTFRNPLIHTRTFAGVRNVSFSKNFAYVLNE